VWDRLRKQIEVEIEQLQHLLATYRPLLEESKEAAPTEIELSALAAMLHSFYTGVENIFKRVAVEVDKDMPRGEMWHRDLLERMGRGSRFRRPVISPSLKERLREYLEFRHVFRQAYSFQLRWDKMRSLVSDCQQLLHSLRNELEAFLRTRGPKT